MVTPAAAQGTGSIDVELVADPPTGVDIEVYATNVSTSRAPIYQRRWGQFGIGPGLFDIPMDVAIAPDDTVYVADLGQCSIQKFDAFGGHLATWERCGLSPGQFYDLDVIAVAPNGDVFAADSKLFQSDIHRFDSSGAHELTWQLGYSFILPGGMAIDAAGNVYITEASHNRVKKFDPDGNPLLEWGSSGTSNGRFVGPLGVAVDAMGNVYIVDSGNSRVQKFTDQGVHLATWRDVFTAGLFPPGLSDIAVDSAGYVYVSDSANNRIFKLSPDGTPIVVWGTLGQAAGEFDGPTALAVDGDDHLFVLDSNNYAVQKYRNSMRKADDAAPDDGDGFDRVVSYPALDAGRYRLTTRLPYGWTLDQTNCSDARNLSIADGREVELLASNTVTCTVHIVGPGQITFVNEVEDGNARPTAWRYSIITDTVIADLPTAVAHATPMLLPRGQFTAAVSGPNGYGVVAVDGACTLVDGQIVVAVTANQADTCVVRYQTISQVQVTETFGATSTDEGINNTADGGACFWLTTKTPPDGPITLAVLPRTGQVRADKTLLPITSSNWNNTSPANTSNLVCVQADDDNVADDTGTVCKAVTADVLGTIPSGAEECGDHLAVVDLQIFESYDPAYTGTTPFVSNTTRDLDDDPKTVDVLLRNDDRAGVHFTPAYGVLHVDERGEPVDTHCYWVNLTSQPTAPVSIAISSPDNQVDVVPTQLQFDERTWNVLDRRITSNQVCVRAVNDPRVDGRDTYCAPLNTRVLADGLIDGEVCGDHVAALTHVVSGDDPRYAGLSTLTSASPDFDGNPLTLDVLVRDDDLADVRMTPGTLNIVEGGSTSYDVVLTSEPRAPVLIIQESQQVEFTPENWEIPQPLEYGAPDNAVVEGGRQVTITHMVMSTDLDFHGLLPSPVKVYVADDDSAGMALDTPRQNGRLEVAEGAPGATYGVRLTAEPTAALTITLAAGTQLQITPGTLHFHSGNWNAWQTVTVQAADDPDIEPGVHTALLFHRISSDDPAFQGTLGATLSVDITDNDDAALLFTETTVMTVDEGGTMEALLSVALTSRPTNSVTVHFDGAPALLVEPSTLLFEANTWSMQQTVAIRAVDDAVDRGVTDEQSVTIKVSSDDTDYDNLNVPARTVVVLDNDEAGVVISRQTLAVAVDEEAAYTVKLASEPTAPVAVTVARQDATRVAVQPQSCEDADVQQAACLLFTAVNWNEPQTITVRGLAGGESQLMHDVESLDPRYVGVNPIALTVTVSTPDVGEQVNLVYLPYLHR